jgi:acyl-CoA thioester hydrolase
VEVVHRSTVTEDMIDGLGHMNVRYYGVNADAATRSLLAAAELVRPDQRPVARDIYTRHHREQMAGAHLAVRSGFVALTPALATIYHELFNTESEVLAATFIRKVALAGDQRFSHTAVTTIEIPEHGRPRSLTLDDDPLAGAPSVETLLERGLAMRHPRVVEADECGPDGRLIGERLHELLWRGEPIDPRPWDYHHKGDDGAPVNMAVMESRTVLGDLPSVGDEVQSFGGIVAIGDKTTTRRNWAMDLRTGQPILVGMTIGLAIDLRARRAVALPASIREEAESILAADLL